jgi:hypothetical protein
MKGIAEWTTRGNQAFLVKKDPEEAYYPRSIMGNFRPDQV